MKKVEILKILEKIEDMKTIRMVKIKSEDFELVVEKTEPHQRISTRESTNFERATTINKKPNDDFNPL